MKLFTKGRVDVVLLYINMTVCAINVLINGCIKLNIYHK